MKQCPECGSQTGLREIIYGLPDKPFDDELYETGGCCISEKDPELVTFERVGIWTSSLEISTRAHIV
jgi:hypothetical protein